MVLTYSELNKEWDYPKKTTDEKELEMFDSFKNDFTGKIEHDNCLKLKIGDVVYLGGDDEFEEILSIFPNHKFELSKYENKYNTFYEGYLDKESDYFKLIYNGGWLSKFDLVCIELQGSQEDFELIKQKYNLK
jgi:hypothetical protein